MEVCALVSGGKDSLFNIKICEELGHSVTCLANLHPQSSQVEELDSFVYQTVGHNLLPILAKAMSLPLVRRAIQGSPVLVESNEYVETVDDETEDLYCLLKTVKDQFPTVTAVSVGAIFSDYQRLRVENVASRLGLKVLAFLWRQTQTEIVSRMIAANLDARIVKVASFGLEAGHVGQSISSLVSHFHKLHRQFGFHVAGEGGEYESFVVRFPGVVKFPINFTNTQVVPHGPDVWYLRTEAEISDQPESECPVATYPDLHDGSYYEKDFKRESEIEWPVDKEFRSQDSPKQSVNPGLELQWAESSSWDVGALFAERFSRKDLDKTIFVELQIADMDKFALVNEGYSKIFTSSPPARCTIQSALPGDIKIRARIILSETQFTRLHVQSISTWAMACIGPYAQAVTSSAHGGVCLTSGVLGLVPHSMTLATDWRSEIFHTMRSLNHVVTVAMKQISDPDKLFALVQISEKAPSVEEVEATVRQYLPNFRLLIVRLPRLPRDVTVEINFILGLQINIDSDISNESILLQSFYDVNKFTADHIRTLSPHSPLTPCLEIGDCERGLACVRLLEI